MSMDWRNDASWQAVQAEAPTPGRAQASAPTRSSAAPRTGPMSAPSGAAQPTEQPQPGGQRPPLERREWQRRTREQIVRDITLALSGSGGPLMEQSERARGFDPYDASAETARTDVWRRRSRRG